MCDLVSKQYKAIGQVNIPKNLAKNDADQWERCNNIAKYNLTEKL